ncbi:stage II sporulation protein M [Gordoniibacillus kamchatkensis]|uniref:Stage II sporulation protein M n=2 Tax=Gordoniibacillus kamchatkensis TaxID=1590651 RepID=A0ABR5A7V2_9BACL|nr:stage II sporulation protein M [Paenibacillus sp. VKM B-2647]KIL37082.1 stage II sporulation protein M [Paenibacillus sp. VKM B-2647]
MKSHLALYMFVSVLFLIGVVFGAVMVNALSLDQKQELARHLNYFFQNVDDGTMLGEPQADSFRQTLGLHVKWMALIWLLGLSVVGLPLVFVLDFLKGVLVGFTVGYLTGQFAWKGMLFALVSVAPQNLVIIPVILIASVAATGFSLHLIKSRFQHRRGALAQSFWQYTGTSVFLTIVLSAAALYEGFLSPYVMKWVAPMLLV